MARQILFFANLDVHVLSQHRPHQVLSWLVVQVHSILGLTMCSVHLPVKSIKIKLK